jgi:hypothetical protein
LPNRELEMELQSALLRATRECQALGCYPTQFLNMLQDYGPVIAAVHQVMAEGDSESIETLDILQRLDLTVEAIILQDPFRPLFLPEVLERAEQKLREFGYLT